MKKPVIIALLGATLLAGPAFAAGSDAVSQDRQDIQSDKGAIAKDNAALQKDNQNLAGNRAAKAQDKVNGDYGQQAVDSVKIGANQTAIGEKQGERGVDNKILQHHQNNLQSDQSQSSNESSTSNQ